MTNPDNFFIWIAKVTYTITKLMVIGAYRGVKRKLDDAFKKSVDNLKPESEPDRSQTGKDLVKALEVGIPAPTDADDDTPLGVNNSMLLHDVPHSPIDHGDTSSLRTSLRSNIPTFVTLKASTLPNPKMQVVRFVGPWDVWEETLVEGEVQRDQDGIVYVTAKNELGTLYRRSLTQQAGIDPNRKKVSAKELVVQYGSYAAVQLNEHSGPSFNADGDMLPLPFVFDSISDVVEAIRNSRLVRSQEQYRDLIRQLEPVRIAATLRDVVKQETQSSEP